MESQPDLVDGIVMQTREGTFARFILNWPTHPPEYEEFRRIAMHLAWLNANRRLFVGRLAFLETTHARLSTPPPRLTSRKPSRKICAGGRSRGMACTRWNAASQGGS
jgi:hypothetical protein